MEDKLLSLQQEISIISNKLQSSQASAQAAEAKSAELVSMCDDLKSQLRAAKKLSEQKDEEKVLVSILASY